MINISASQTHYQVIFNKRVPKSPRGCRKDRPVIDRGPEYRRSVRMGP